MDIFSKHKIYPIFYNFKWSTTYEILNHCVVHLKLIYYCKSSMLQLKKKKTTRASHSMAQTELQMGLQLPWCICFLPNPQDRSRSSALYPAVMSFFLPLLLSTMIRGEGTHLSPLVIPVLLPGSHWREEWWQRMDHLSQTPSQCFSSFCFELLQPSNESFGKELKVWGRCNG